MARRCAVLDANALMMPFQFRINLDAEIARVLGECDVYVPSSVLAELEGLASRDRDARAALRLAAKYLVHETTGRGDPAIVEAAEALGACVVTSDQKLLRTLRKRGIPRVTLRSRSHLVFES